MSQILLYNINPSQTQKITASLEVIKLSFALYRGNEVDLLNGVIKERPSLCIINSTVVDALNITKNLNKKFKKIIIVIVGHNNEQIQLFFEAGAQGWLEKDSTSAEIKTIIEKCLKGEKPILNLLQQNGQNTTKPKNLPKLTERETLVIDLICKGMTNKEIAEQLGVTESSIKGYLYTAMGKLGIQTRTQIPIIFPEKVC